MVKNNVKRFGALAIVLVLLFSLAACAWERSDGDTDFLGEKIVWRLSMGNGSIQIITDAAVNNRGYEANLESKGLFKYEVSNIQGMDSGIPDPNSYTYIIIPLGVVLVSMGLDGDQTFAGTFTLA